MYHARMKKIPSGAGLLTTFVCFLSHQLFHRGPYEKRLDPLLLEGVYTIIIMNIFATFGLQVASGPPAPRLDPHMCINFVFSSGFMM